MSENVNPQETASYTRMTGEVYDVIYQYKDYEAEAAKLTQIIKENGESSGNRVLEAACGTGNYIKYLRNEFSVDGFDLSAEQVATTQRKFPEKKIVQADMTDFDMGETYDAVLCLFSSIGYVQTTEALKKAIAAMAKHTKPGGLVIVEPWLAPEHYEVGRTSLDAKTDGKLTVSRMSVSTQEGILSVMNMHHMVGDGQRIDHFVETHRLALFTDDDFKESFADAGLNVEIDPEGLTGRRLCIGKKPL